MSQRTTSLLANSPSLTRAYEHALGDVEFIRSLLDISDDCIKILDLEGRLRMMSPGGLRVMEVDDFAPIDGCVWLDLWNGPHSADAHAAFQEARDGRIGRFRGFADTMKGNRRFWDVRISPIAGADGKPRAFTSISRDITAVHEAEERRNEALTEMRHRAKNALTIVQAIAQQTLKSGGEQLNPVSRTFTQRLQALARSYDALVMHDWAAADLRDLVLNTLVPFDDQHASRIDVDGPDVQVLAANAMALGLAINELATNAAKYGALSNATGRVSLTWKTEGDPARLSMLWTETGGPEVQPPQRRGFGSALIDRALPGELGGSVRILYLPAGVVCEIDLPLKV